MFIFCIFHVFFGIAFIGTLILFLKLIINFIRFGGESIAYTKKMSRKTIYDVFAKLNEMQQYDQLKIKEEIK